jgi:hypothetical protein
MTSKNTVKLRVPHQDQDQSSFFECEETAVANWVAALPMANLGQSTKQLYQALVELNQVRLLPQQRLLLLDQLRTPVYFVTRALEKYYLNQAITLPEQASKVVDLCHTLHQTLATGYTVVAAHTVSLGKRSGVGNPAELVAQAIHRATTDHSVNMVRHFQLYEPIDSSVWHRLHQLYLLAKQHKILDQKVLDKECGLCTVGESYIRALLLGCGKPNQLRQEDFKQLLSPLTQWSALCTLSSANNNSLFVINPTGDNHPVYRSLFESALTDEWLSLDTMALVEHLHTLEQQADPKSTTLPDGDGTIPRDLIQHLHSAWSSMAERSFIRIDTSDELELCIGLSSTHHFLSDELSFDAFVAEHGAKTLTVQQDNPFLPTTSHQARKKDVWDSPYENNLGQTDIPRESIEYNIQKHQSEDTSAKGKYHSQRVSMVNSSAHGYCVQWPTEVSVQIKTGEVAAVKDSNSHNWNIAVIRWVGQEEGGFQLGLELLSPSAAPYGARIIQKTGGPADYMRVMVLPEIIPINQPITLLTPRVPFRENQKLELNQHGKKVQVRLGKRLNTSGNYNQFEFKKVSGVLTSSDPDSAGGKNDFDSLWGSL